MNNTSRSNKRSRSPSFVNHMFKPSFQFPMDRNRCVVLYHKTPIDLRIEDRAIPVAGPGSVVIKVLVCTSY